MAKAPRIADREIEDEIRRRRRTERRETLLLVVERAEEYATEARREDDAHKARLHRREQALREAITFAYEAMNPGPITDDERAHVRRVLEAALIRR